MTDEIKPEPTKQDDDLMDYTRSLVSQEEFAKSNVGKELMGLLFPEGESK